MVGDNEKVVELMMRAGNASSGRDPQQCASQTKKRGTASSSTEEAPDSDGAPAEREEPRRFSGALARGWDFMKLTEPSPAVPPSLTDGGAGGDVEQSRSTWRRRQFDGGR